MHPISIDTASGSYGVPIWREKKEVVRSFGSLNFFPSINQSINHQRCWSRHLYLPNRFHQPQWNSTNPNLDQPIVVQCKMTGTILISTPILLRASRHSLRSGRTPTNGPEVNSHVRRESERLLGTHHPHCIKDYPPQPASHGIHK